jgi:hypothetical protein
MVENPESIGFYMKSSPFWRMMLVRCPNSLYLDAAPLLTV